MIEKRKFTIRITKQELFAAVKAYFPHVIGVQAIPPNAKYESFGTSGADVLDIFWDKEVVSVHRTDGGPGGGDCPTGGTPVAAEEMAEGFSHDYVERKVA